MRPPLVHVLTLGAAIGRKKSKAIALASVIAGLCITTFARAQDVVVVSGVKYRVAAGSASLTLAPDAPFTTPQSARALPEGEKLSRCDEFVALALEAKGLARSGDIRLVRDRVEARPDNKTWVLYAQRHQGYKILWAGGRVELDSYGRVLMAGLKYETEKLRDFRPMDSAALEKLAAAALPHPRVESPLQQELMIDPLRDAPAELRAYFIYQVQNNDRVEPWQVILNAETGKVVDSFSAVMNAETPQAEAPIGAKARPETSNRPRPAALDRPRPAAGRVEPVPGPSNIYVEPLTVYVDIYGQCISLQIQYINDQNQVETRIVTYNDVLSVYPGSSMTVSDATYSSTTCSRSFELNYSPRSLPCTFTPMDFDDLSFDEDCRPAVRSAEGTSPICFNRNLYIDRIQPSQLTYNTTLSEGPITSVAQYSSPSNFLSVPCQTVQIPPSSLTVSDNTRFDEVNSFYQARDFIQNYFSGSLGIPLGRSFRILTKEPESFTPVTGYDPFAGIIYFGAGSSILGSLDASKFASVIRHEASHVLECDLYGSFLPNQETKAISEGLADYMAATYANNPAVGVCFLSNYDHLRNADNLPSDFQYSKFNTCQYPVSTGATSARGDFHTQGMIASGLLWDMHQSIGSIATDRILKYALFSLVHNPDFTEFGAAILAGAQYWNYECQVRPLLVARQFPGISAGGAVPPTGLNVSTSMPDRCYIHAYWTGTAQAYKVTWTPDGGAEQVLNPNLVGTNFNGSVGTIGGGTVKVYSIYCGATNNTPASARRDAVTATSQSPAIRLTPQTVAGGTQVLIDWDDVPGTPNWRLLRNGVAFGNDMPGSQHSKIDPPGCGGTFTYCIQIVDCGGSHGVGPCQTITRAGSPLAVTLSGPTSLPYGVSGTFTANISGGCGLSRIDWYWMTECTGGGGNPPPRDLGKGPGLITPASAGGLPVQPMIEPCGVFFRYSVPTLANPIQKGFSHGSYSQIKVIVTDNVGATAQAIIRIRTGSSMTYEPSLATEPVAESANLPPRLEWDGTSIALANVKSASGETAKLQVFDVAGRRQMEAQATIASSGRTQFPALKDLARGIYFAQVEISGRRPIRRTIVLK